MLLELIVLGYRPSQVANIQTSLALPMGPSRKNRPRSHHLPTPRALIPDPIPLRDYIERPLDVNQRVPEMLRNHIGSLHTLNETWWRPLRRVDFG